MTRSKSDNFDTNLIALARYAKALSHPARLAILQTLARRNSCICGEIVEVMPLAQSTVSQHLKELKEVGLITGEVEGLKSCYCLDARALKEFEKLTTDLFNTLNKNFQSTKCR